MSMIAPPDDAAHAFEFRSTDWRLVAFAPATLDPVKLEISLREKLGKGEHLLSGEQVALDFSSFPEIPSAMEVAGLTGLLRQFDLHTVAACGGNKAQMAAAKEAGLIAIAEDGVAPSAIAHQAPAQAVRAPTLVINKAVRTGQQIYAKQGDLVVLGLVSAGAEVIADGDIHVYGPLRGRAMAGARGDTSARIYTTCLEAEIVSLGGVYRTLEDNLPASLKAKPAQIYLDQDRLIIEALSDTH